MIFTALLFGMGLLALLIGATTSVSNSIANQQAKNVEIELAKVKDALIGWSASRTPPTGGADARPAELPCPDNDAPGSAGYGYDDGSCGSGPVSVSIGRIPWKTLGIPEPKDESGETLWYAIAAPFRNYNMSGAPITSDTLGNITVYSGSTATTLTAQAVAVIFAPGPPISTQDRDPSTTALCNTTATTIARNRCAENYLDALSGINNATPNSSTPPSFIQAQIQSSLTATFNDRLLAITNADLMPVVEQRVAREMRSLLQNYKTATATSATYPGGIYPWADRADGNSNAGENRSRFPCGTASPVNWNTLVPGSIPATNTPALPNWLTNGCGSNGWARVIYYTAGSNWLDIATVPCPLCSGPSLRVNGVPDFELVLLTPGAASISPRGTWTSTPGDAITGYFEDSENSNNNNDDYVTPTSTAYNRDRIFTVLP